MHLKAVVQSDGEEIQPFGGILGVGHPPDVKSTSGVSKKGGDQTLGFSHPAPPPQVQLSSLNSRSLWSAGNKAAVGLQLWGSRRVEGWSHAGARMDPWGQQALEGGHDMPQPGQSPTVSNLAQSAPPALKEGQRNTIPACCAGIAAPLC